MDILAIGSYINSIEENKTLIEERNFDKRAEAIDFIEFHIIDQLQNTNYPHELLLLKDKAEKIKAELEAIDLNLFKMNTLILI